MEMAELDYEQSGVEILKFRIISVGKIRETFYQAGVQEYLKRLGPYIPIELVDGLEEKINARAGEQDIKKILQKEGLKILQLIDDQDRVVVCDLGGAMFTSEKLAEYMYESTLSGKNRLDFIIGSSFGLSEAVKERADQVISFSKMTFPHQMAVLILTEQIYRGFKILKREPYHK